MGDHVVLHIGFPHLDIAGLFICSFEPGEIIADRQLGPILVPVAADPDAAFVADHQNTVVLPHHAALAAESGGLAAGEGHAIRPALVHFLGLPLSPRTGDLVAFVEVARRVDSNRASLQSIDFRVSAEADFIGNSVRSSRIPRGGPDQLGDLRRFRLGSQSHLDSL